MFEFRRRKQKVSGDGDPGRPPRFFQDGVSALRYACRFFDCPLAEGAFLPAVVLDPQEVLGAKPRTSTRHVHFLCVASVEGGFVVAAPTAGPSGPQLLPGQLVAWKAVRHVPEIAVGMSDERFGWAGVIVGTLKLELRDGCWVSEDIFRAETARASGQG